MGDSLKAKVAIVTGAGSVSGPPELDLVGNGKACAMAEAALFLVSDKAKYITGHVLTVDGGLVLTGG